MNKLTSWSLVAVCALVIAGCSDKKRPTPGQACVMNTDCNAPLTCTFGKCHETCREARDCAVGQLCAKGPAGSVCVLPEEQRCGLNSMCPVGLFCSQDLKCRNQCEMDRDCATSSQKCVASGSNKVCAEPADIDTAGMLKPASDAGAPADAGGSADGGADAATGDVVTQPPPGPSCTGVTEREPNETRETATPYTAGTPTVACLGSATDVDVYEITSPMDMSGGYYEGAITEVGEVSVEVKVHTASDNSEILSGTYSVDLGGSLYFYWAAAPGQKYRLTVSRFIQGAAAPARYSMNVTYTKVDDPHEPNDSRDQTKPLTLGTQLSGYFFAGHTTKMIADTAYEDWFTVNLAAGMVSITMGDVPTNIQPEVILLDPLGTLVPQTGNVNPTPGGSLMAMTPIMTPGAYKVVVQIWSTLPQPAGKIAAPGMVPDSFKRAYKLTVSQ